VASSCLNRCEETKKYADLHFIMMTAESTIDKIVKSKRAGVSCFIRKPFNAAELQAKISQTNAELRHTAPR